MRTWTRMRLDGHCGGCGRFLPTGAPCLELHLGLKYPKLRCEDCDGPAPPDLAPLHADPITTPRTPLLMTRFSADMLPLDFKRLQAREPGEEG